MKRKKTLELELELWSAGKAAPAFDPFLASVTAPTPATAPTIVLATTAIDTSPAFITVTNLKLSNTQEVFVTLR